MKDWSTAMRDGTVSGSVASILSTGALAALSKRDAGNPYLGTNAISHWAWGEAAFRETRLDWSHTGLGYGIHHASSLLWSTVYEKMFGDRAERGRIGEALAGGLLVAAVASFVDYKMTPRRFEPGFDRHLSTRSMAIFYGVFGIGLALTGILRARRRQY